MRGNSEPRSARRLPLRRLFACALLLAQSGSALADAVMLADRSRMEGLIANRELLRLVPGDAPTIAILTPGAAELLRLDATQVRYFVLEDERQSRLYDLDARRRERGLPTAQPMATFPIPDRRPGGGAARFVLGGIALMTVGIARGFEDEFNGPHDAGTEKNWPNIILAGVGTVVAFAGFVVSIEQHAAASQWKLQRKVEF